MTLSGVSLTRRDLAIAEKGGRAVLGGGVDGDDFQGVRERDAETASILPEGRERSGPPRPQMNDGRHMHRTLIITVPPSADLKEFPNVRVHRIAAIPGDGIGIEVIAAGLKVLEVLADRDRTFRLEVEHFPWSSEYYKSSDSLYYRYPPEMRIPIYNRGWQNEYPQARRYHYGHHFNLDVF